MTQVHSWGPFWCRTIPVKTKWPVWLGRTTQTEGSFRTSIHPVVQIWPGKAVAFGIWGRAHDEDYGLILAMKSFGRSSTPRTEVINEDEDAVGVARKSDRVWDWNDPEVQADLARQTPARAAGLQRDTREM